jgi:hypothetical protein
MAESVMVRPGFTVQMLVVLEARARLPEIVLLPVAVRFQVPAAVPEDPAAKFVEIFRAPVRVFVRTHPWPPLPLAPFVPARVRLPVPALAVMLLV